MILIDSKKSYVRKMLLWISNPSKLAEIKFTPNDILMQSWHLIKQFDPFSRLYQVWTPTQSFCSGMKLIFLPGFGVFNFDNLKRIERKGRSMLHFSPWHFLLLRLYQVSSEICFFPREFLIDLSRNLRVKS